MRNRATPAASTGAKAAARVLSNAELFSEGALGFKKQRYHHKQSERQHVTQRSLKLRNGWRPHDSTTHNPYDI